MTYLPKTRKGRRPWNSPSYATLTESQNEVVRRARRMGFAEIFALYPDEATRDKLTYTAARDFVTRALIERRRAN